MVNSYNYFESSKVKVFPSAFRGTTGETGSSTIDIEARLNTEANFTKRNGALTALKDSYLIDWSGNKIKCVISGYYFEIDAEGVTLKEENKNYYLKIWPVETVLDSGENKTRVLGLANNIAGNLDSEGKFKGLGYIEKPSTESYTEANSLCISKNNAVNYMALLPKEVLHGDEEHSIKIDGSLTDLTVDGDTTIGEGLVITDAKTGDVKKQIIVGQYNNKKNDNCIFEVGSGTSDSDRSDILQVTKDTVSVTNSGLLSTSNITTDVKVKSRIESGTSTDVNDGGHIVLGKGTGEKLSNVRIGNLNGSFRTYWYKDGEETEDNYRGITIAPDCTIKQAIGSDEREVINNKGEATDITLTETDPNANDANVKFKVGKKVFSKTVNNVSHSTNSTTADKLTTARKLGTTTITYAEATKKSSTIDFDGSSTDAYYIPLPSDLLANSITTSNVTCTDVFKASVVDNSAQIDLLDSDINFTVPELGTFLNVNTDSAVYETDLYLTGNLFIDKHDNDLDGKNGNLTIMNGNLKVKKGSISVGSNISAGSIDVDPGDVNIKEGELIVGAGDLTLNNGQVRYGDEGQLPASTAVEFFAIEPWGHVAPVIPIIDLNNGYSRGHLAIDLRNLTVYTKYNSIDLISGVGEYEDEWDNAARMFNKSDYKKVDMYPLYLAGISNIPWSTLTATNRKNFLSNNITNISIYCAVSDPVNQLKWSWLDIFADITPIARGKNKVDSGGYVYRTVNHGPDRPSTTEEAPATCHFRTKSVYGHGAINGINSDWLIIQFDSLDYRLIASQPIQYAKLCLGSIKIQTQR